MFSKYRYIIVNLVFSYLGYWSGNFFLIAPFPDQLVFNSFMVDNYAAFFNCTPVGRASDYDGPDIKLFILVGWGRSFLSVAWSTGVQFGVFLLLWVSVSYSAPRDLHRRVAY